MCALETLPPRRSNPPGLTEGMVRNLIFWLTLAALFPSLARADASVSSDGGRSIENGQSDTLRRDKSLSADKSHGNKATVSASREKALEKSRSHSKSKKLSKTAGVEKRASVDVNINGLLLREFTARYERDGTATGKAGEYFGLCKPLTRALADYPVMYFDLDGMKIIGRNEAQQLNNARAMALTMNMMVSFGHNNLFVSRYVQCRMTASYWVAEAGERANAQQISTEAEVGERIRQVFAAMDNQESVFATLRQRARNLWAQETCSRQLQTEDEFKAPELQCGVFSYVGNVFTVENRETLSEAGINGHSYKIAVSASSADSVAADESLSADERISSSKRRGISTERYREARNSAGLTQSKSLDQNSGSTLDRSSGNSIHAAPKE